MIDTAELLETASLELEEAKLNSTEDGIEFALLNAEISKTASLLVIAKALVHIADYGIPKDRSGRIN